jgi:hypothetical protein
MKGKQHKISGLGKDSNKVESASKAIANHANRF